MKIAILCFTMIFIAGCPVVENDSDMATATEDAGGTD